MGVLSADTELKVKNIMDEIEHSDLQYDEKTFQQEKILQARACANGSADKIDDISKVLLQSAIHEVKTEIRLPSKIRNVVREELAETEKNITAIIRQEIKEHAAQCWSKIAEYKDSFAKESFYDGKSTTCYDCGSTKGMQVHEAHDVAEAKEDDPKTFGTLAIKWLNDMRKQSPILAGIFVVIIIEKYGLEKILGFLGLK